MENEIYIQLVNNLSFLLGAAEPLVSGNGARFKSARKGKATIYHNEIATGNRAEVAFHTESIAARMNITQAELQSLLEQWRRATGRPVKINQQYEWPRVGCSTKEHVSSLVSQLQLRLCSEP